MIHASRFEVRSEPRTDGTLLRLGGELDIATVPQVEGAMEAAIAGGARHVVVDLRQLTFIDSSGLRLFILLSDRSREQGWQLSIVRPPDPARAVFRLTGAEENLPFVEEPPPA